MYSRQGTSHENRKIHLKNFKIFQNVTIEDLPSFCVVVGANRSGKSTLFDVFGFLKDCMTYNVARALQVRGGFQEVVSRGHAQESIEIEIQYRISISARHGAQRKPLVNMNTCPPVVTTCNRWHATFLRTIRLLPIKKYWMPCERVFPVMDVLSYNLATVFSKPPSSIASFRMALWRCLPIWCCIIKMNII